MIFEYDVYIVPLLLLTVSLVLFSKNQRTDWKKSTGLVAGLTLIFIHLMAMLIWQTDMTSPKWLGLVYAGILFALLFSLLDIKFFLGDRRWLLLHFFILLGSIFTFLVDGMAVTNDWL